MQNLGIHKRRTLFAVRSLFTFGWLFYYAHSDLSNSTVIPTPFDDATMFFDVNAHDYETVLTPIDFETALQINDIPKDRANVEDGAIDDSWDSEAMYAVDKFEGDIANDGLNATTVLLFIRGAPENTTDINIQLNAIRDRRQLWKNGRIPYALSSQYSSYSRSVIASAMQEYSKHTCIQWVPRTANDRDYVYIVPDRGCYSMVGRTGGRQTLSLGNGCIQKGIIIHEMMHATGFFHEQSRTDRDDYISILWHNILPGMQGQFEKYSQATIQTLGADYDFSSIMHYGPSAFTRNGMPTIVPKRVGASIGQRSGFSRIDAYKINTLYECPNYGGVVATTLPPQLTPPQPQPITLMPQTFISSTLAPPSTAPTTRPPTTELSGIRVCKNTRPDCDDLARQGWCLRNPGWMREYCPVSCGLCPAEKQRPPTIPSEPCEDLRVDCAELAKRRYCITAQSFTRTYCARSCGFCFVPPVTEIPESRTTQSVYGATTPTLVTRSPMVTFWPFRPDERIVAVTESSPKGRFCRDKKHFCVAWKKSGFCQGIFLGYMKKNCPSSCGWC